jgi:ParB-like chromosome segregation protein Spo0J
MLLPIANHDDTTWDESPEPTTDEPTEVKSKSKKAKSKKTKSKKAEAKKSKSKSKSASPTVSPAVKAKGPSYKVTWIPLGEIKVDIATRCRSVLPGVVETLVGGIAKDGLRTPLTIRWLDGVAHLVAGLQRLDALKALKWAEAPCVCENDELAAQRWQITENLYRGELTKLQRANQTAALLALSEATEEISGEKVQKKKRGRPEGGDAKAARTLPVRGKTADAKRKNIAKDRKISGIHSDAQQAMVEAGLSNDEDALVEVAYQPTREAQLAKVNALAKGSGKLLSKQPGSEGGEADSPLEEAKREFLKATRLLRALKRLSEAECQAFLCVV